jgi:hypothetical protein
MTTRQIPKRDADELKRASLALAEAAGGVIEAARLTSSQPSRMSEACSPFHDARWMSLIHIADLECATGQPHVTRTLAGLGGFALVALEPSKPQGLSEHLATIIKECSEVELSLAQAMADGRLSPQERHDLRTETRQAIERLEAFESDLKRPLNDVPDAGRSTNTM